MTREGIIRKCRKNPDFIAATRLLDDLGVEWSLVPARGKGHPKLVFEGGSWPVGSSPGARCNPRAVAAGLRRYLIERGIVSETS